jgi:hypothetical protein
LSLTQARIPAAGHRRAESPRVAADLPGCDDSQGTPHRPTPLAEPHSQHRTPELRPARHARRISLPTIGCDQRHAPGNRSRVCHVSDTSSHAVTKSSAVSPPIDPARC